MENEPTKRIVIEVDVAADWNAADVAFFVDHKFALEGLGPDVPDAVVWDSREAYLDDVKEGMI